MAKEKKVKEIDVESLDSELAAARTLEDGKGSPKIIKLTTVIKVVPEVIIVLDKV